MGLTKHWDNCDSMVDLGVQDLLAAAAEEEAAEFNEAVGQAGRPFSCARGRLLGSQPTPIASRKESKMSGVSGSASAAKSQLSGKVGSQLSGKAGGASVAESKLSGKAGSAASVTSSEK